MARLHDRPDMTETPRFFGFSSHKANERSKVKELFGLFSAHDAGNRNADDLHLLDQGIPIVSP